MDAELRNYYEKALGYHLGEDLVVLGQDGEPAKLTWRQKIQWRWCEAKRRLSRAVTVLRTGDDGRDW